MAQAIHIPDIGDVEEVQVIELCVVPGDTVGPEDALIVIESDKASMEVPAGVSGVIEALTVAVGDDVAEGQIIALINSAAAQNAEPDQPPQITETAVEPARAGGERETAPLPSASQVDQGSSRVEICLPDIGDAQDVAVIEVSVSVGDSVNADDLLVVVESDKASMEIPAGFAGKVLEVHVTEGAEVTEGTLLVTMEVSGGVEPKEEVLVAVAENEHELTLAEKQRQLPAPPVAGSEPEPDMGKSGSVYAGPAVRRLARELGVDLTEVQGSGTRERIVKDDVKAFVKSFLEDKPTGRSTGTPGGGIPPIPLIDFSKFGPVESSPLTRVRIIGATNLHRSWLNIPHVTQFDSADLTELETFRRSLKDEGLARGVKVTPLAFIVKACCYALKAFPTFNASLDAEARNFILKKYYHIGFAVDTEQGLVVPVIKDADQLGIWELSEEISALAGKAREHKLAVDDMRGASFSISSLGAIGGTGFTPIINAPEVAILGVARLTTQPVWDGTEFAPRQMLPLSLSYDHRAINGAEAGRFVVHLAELLGDIRRLSL
ncbi:MAG: dihydrolipoyllysine-residue acetyltransferase [Gammaproteobacteria bacterium]|nr:MAG: dihydrolipoyllysine-residue acetyltransferase [Gammaproteobacteria bacterium]